MKMFLTRLGFGSKIVVTGDVTQTDLPTGQKSGLRAVEDILDDIEDISFNRLTSHDVVRHKLVGRIVAAYDEFDARADGHREPHRDSPRDSHRDPHCDSHREGGRRPSAGGRS
jgi:phosphate starvation-inducible PhoH-like protein